jgi:hypothetical protein
MVANEGSSVREVERTISQTQGRAAKYMILTSWAWPFWSAVNGMARPTNQNVNRPNRSFDVDRKKVKIVMKTS